VERARNELAVTLPCMQQEQLNQIAANALIQLSIPSSNDSSENKDCTAFFFDAEGRVTDSVTGTDPYEVLTFIGFASLPPRSIGIGLVAPGWMSPMGETAPSDHPDRVRIEICNVLDISLKSSASIRISTTGEFFDEQANGEGPLLDVMRQVLFRCVINSTEEAEHF
jgi:hypothetical protein